MWLLIEDLYYPLLDFLSGDILILSDSSQTTYRFYKLSVKPCQEFLLRRALLVFHRVTVSTSELLKDPPYPYRLKEDEIPKSLTKVEYNMSKPPLHSAPLSSVTPGVSPKILHNERFDFCFHYYMYVNKIGIGKSNIQLV